LQEPFHDVSPMLLASSIMEGVRPDPPNLGEEYDFLEDIYLCCTSFHPEDRPSLFRVKAALLDQTTVAKAPSKAPSSSSMKKQTSLPLLTISPAEPFPLPSHCTQQSLEHPEESLKSLSAARGLSESGGRLRSRSFNDLRSLEHDANAPSSVDRMMKMINETNALAVQGKRERKKISSHTHKVQTELNSICENQLPAITERVLAAIGTVHDTLAHNSEQTIRCFREDLLRHSSPTAQNPLLCLILGMLGLVLGIQVMLFLQ